MEATVKLYSLSYNRVKTYLFALLFIAGNIILPQVCHLVPNGGLTLLPIYFFTLIAAYKYGIQVGLLTAIVSPLVNHVLFGMPAMEVLPVILIKSGLLAIAASVAAHYSKRVSLFAILLTVLAYQVIGLFAEWGITGSLQMAIQDFRIGLPGIQLQIFGGYALLRLIARI